MLVFASMKSVYEVYMVETCDAGVDPEIRGPPDSGGPNQANTCDGSPDTRLRMPDSDSDSKITGTFIFALTLAQSCRNSCLPRCREERLQTVNVSVQDSSFRATQACEFTSEHQHARLEPDSVTLATTLRSLRKVVVAYILVQAELDLGHASSATPGALERHILCVIQICAQLWHEHSLL